MNRLLQNFIDQLHAADSEPEFKDSMTTAAEALGLPRFVYLGISKRAMLSPLVITTYPGAWAHRYLGQAYPRVDPVVSRAFSDHAPFHWGTEDTLRGLSHRQCEGQARCGLNRRGRRQSRSRAPHYPALTLPPPVLFDRHKNSVLIAVFPGLG